VSYRASHCHMMTVLHFYISVAWLQVLDDFALNVPAASWPVGSEAAISFPQLYTYLAKYQNPREADAMTKIQDELDETKIILVRNSPCRRPLFACYSCL